MTFVRVSAGTICALTLAAGLVACQEGAKSGIARGTVVSVDPTSRVVVIDHGHFPGMMTAMKMSFEVSEPALLRDIEPGENVEFEVERRMGVYRVTAIRPQQP